MPEANWGAKPDQKVILDPSGEYKIYQISPAMVYAGGCTHYFVQDGDEYHYHCLNCPNGAVIDTATQQVVDGHIVPL